MEFANVFCQCFVIYDVNFTDNLDLCVFYMYIIITFTYVGILGINMQHAQMNKMVNFVT